MIVPGIILVGGEHPIGDQAIGRIVLPFRDFDDLLCELERGLHSSAQRRHRAEAEQHGDALQIRADAAVEQPFRGVHHFIGLGGGDALQRHERVGARHQKRQLERVAFASFGDGGDQREPGAGMALGFHRRRLRQRQLGRAQPGGGGRGCEPGFGEVMGDGCGRIFLFGDVLLQRPGDLGVDALAAAAQERAVGGILDQRVLERVARLGRRAAAMNQLGVDQLAQHAIERIALDRRDRLQQRVRKFAADRSSDLRGFLDRRQAVEPRRQGVVQGRGDRKRRQRGCEHIRIVLLAQQLGFQHALGQFLHEQRHAVGLRHDLVEHFRRQFLARRHAIDHPQGLMAREAVEQQGAGMALASPGW